jgi:hypothetical protein
VFIQHAMFTLVQLFVRFWTEIVIYYLRRWKSGKTRNLGKADLMLMNGLARVKKFEISVMAGYLDDRAGVMSDHPAVGSAREIPSLGVTESSALS